MAFDEDKLAKAFEDIFGENPDDTLDKLLGQARKANDNNQFPTIHDAMAAIAEFEQQCDELNVGDYVTLAPNCKGRRFPRKEENQIGKIIAKHQPVVINGDAMAQYLVACAINTKKDEGTTSRVRVFAFARFELVKYEFEPHNNTLN